MSNLNQAEDPNNDTNATDEAAKAGTSCKVPCTITSQTIALQPPNRNRLRVGAGEEVDLTVSPGTATWTATPNDLIELPADAGTTASTAIRIKALDKAGNVTITAKTKQCECTITLTVVLPTSTYMEPVPGTPRIHLRGGPSCGWFGRLYVIPKDVNFYNVYRRELDDIVSATGAFAKFGGSYHGDYPLPDRVGPWSKLDAYDSNKGSFNVEVKDGIFMGGDRSSIVSESPRRFMPGKASTLIRWQWTIDKSGTNHHAFPAFRQEVSSNEVGSCTISKGGHSETSEAYDETTGWNRSTGELDSSIQ